jgi:2-polyprenyl-3-methyl-5-hydroxy-6-metoxy-1,4-benzoquinol methylase
MYGTTAASMLNEVTQTYFGKSLADFRDICDWGCGCGRVAQAVHRLAPKANITGLDIDRDNIDWCQQNLTYARFAEVPLFPPSPIADGQFDLLYGISVFTHLTREAFEAWRDEVYRMVRPGGLVLVTINRGAALARVANEGLVHRTHASGFDDSSLDSALDGKIVDGTYYRGTYLMTHEAKRIFGARFRIRDIIPQASGTSQDLVVCERLPAAATGRPASQA